jgi:hypothetical protein
MPHMLPFDAGLAMDWDFGDYGNRDTAWFDLTDSIMFATRAERRGYPVAAMKFYSKIPSAASLAWYVMSGNGSDPGYGPDALGSKAAKYRLFQQNKSTGLRGDIAILLGVHNMQAPVNVNSMSYVIALGENVPMARYNLQSAFAAVNGEKLPDPPKVGLQLAQAAKFQIWPNPTSGMIHVVSDEPVQILITDMLGREALRTGERDVNVSELPAGVYDVEAIGSGRTIHCRIVRQ